MIGELVAIGIGGYVAGIATAALLAIAAIGADDRAMIRLDEERRRRRRETLPRWDRYPYRPGRG